MDTEPVVVDVGTYNLRAGFAGDDVPAVTFRTLAEGGDGSVGEEARQRVLQGAEAIYPVDHGIVREWDAMERIFRYMFTRLNRPARNQGILLSEPMANPQQNREKTAELFFETFGVPALYLAPSGVLALYMSGRTTGITLTVGDGVTEAVPIYEGFAYAPEMRSIHLAGSDISNLFAQTLEDKGLHFFDGAAGAGAAGFEIGTMIKEKLGYVALDYEAELARGAEGGARVFALPDGRSVEVGAERFRHPEALFQPSVLQDAGLGGGAGLGVHRLVLDSIKGCPIDVRRDLFTNIVVSGDTSKLPGFTERLRKEIAAGLPEQARWRVVQMQEEAHVWLGGSILGSLSCFNGIYMTRALYDEYGPGGITRHCPPLPNGRPYDREEVLL